MGKRKPPSNAPVMQANTLQLKSVARAIKSYAAHLMGAYIIPKYRR